jgi:hypothetical protein
MLGSSFEESSFDICWVQVLEDLALTYAVFKIWRILLWHNMLGSGFGGSNFDLCWVQVLEDLTLTYAGFKFLEDLALTYPTIQAIFFTRWAIYAYFSIWFIMVDTCENVQFLFIFSDSKPSKVIYLLLV